MRRDITFNSKGLKCSGWYYLPDALREGTKVPAIVMAHGFSAVKEHFLDRYAERFAEAGFGVIVFDYRFLGTSEGEPRQQILWHEQIDDYRYAISWACDQPEVDPDRIGIWGTSYSGSHVIWLGAYDSRVKAVVCQVYGGKSTYDLFSSLLGQEGISQFMAMVENSRSEQQRSGAITYMPIVAEEGQPAALPDADANAWFLGNQMPTWENSVTADSLGQLIEYDLTSALKRISPTPLMMILAEKDTLVPFDEAKELFDSLAEPKALKRLACRHFEPYNKEPWFSEASQAASDWFKQHLL